MNSYLWRQILARHILNLKIKISKICDDRKEYEKTLVSGLDYYQT